METLAVLLTLECAGTYFLGGNYSVSPWLKFQENNETHEKQMALVMSYGHGGYLTELKRTDSFSTFFEKKSERNFESTFTAEKDGKHAKLLNTESFDEMKKLAETGQAQFWMEFETGEKILFHCRIPQNTPPAF